MKSVALRCDDLTARLGRWMRWRVGLLLSRLGEATGSAWLTYNPLHFYSFHHHALRNSPGVMAAIGRVFSRERRYLDIGAGSGAFAAEAMRRGGAVVALEHSAAGRRIGRKLGVDIRPFNLTRDMPAEVAEVFDLAYCFEVAEHLPPSLGDRLVKFAAARAPVVVFTAAHPGQRGTGHVNEQPKEYWIERFAEEGMRHCSDLSQRLAEEFAKERVAPWFVENVMVFERQPAPQHYVEVAKASST